MMLTREDSGFDDGNIQMIQVAGSWEDGSDTVDRKHNRAVLEPWWTQLAWKPSYYKHLKKLDKR